ncbi:MAG TPA: hypothetical protein VMZ51_00895 [Acidimicrobiales bacterium]|nr:hypothetical protein [Acidimicrobiales bacterium]
MAEAISRVGCLPSGSRYVVEVPARWNGVLLLSSHPVPVAPGEPPWEPDEPLTRHLVSMGYAVAGSANTIFWPLERVFADQPDLVEVATGILGPPLHTIALGLSIGGIISAGALQVHPDLLSGALPLGGNLAGAVSNHNRELDIAFVVKTLLAPDSPLRIVNIDNSQHNLALATTVLHKAQATREGRARLALAAAVGNIPGWHDPGSAEPAVDDFEARQRNQFTWFDMVGFLVFFLARKQVEMQAGANPSWNTGVDYRELLSRSINLKEVEALYGSAALDLEDDLDRLACAERVEACPAALAYLENHIVFDGDLGGAPVLAVHTDGDGLVTPDHEQAYADVVHHARNGDLLRQLYVHRGGHCTFTFAETTTALDVLIARIENGGWPDLEPCTLNAAAGRLGTEAEVLASGPRARAGFFSFEPPVFARRYDHRDVAARRKAATGARVEMAAVPAETMASAG